MRHPYCGDRRTEVLKSGNPQSVVAIKRCGNVKSQDIETVFPVDQSKLNRPPVDQSGGFTRSSR